MDRTKIDGQAKEIEGEIIAIRRQIHQYPEISFNLKRTQRLVLNYLKEAGLESVEPFGKHFKAGVRVTINPDHPGKCVMLRADMDALPMTETAQSPYQSQVEGAMHACGHDAHTAMLLGAAKLLHQNRSDIDGKVVLIFEPAEEISDKVGDRMITGAEDLVEDGLLDGVDECYALHVSAEQESGTIGINYGNTMAAVAAFEVDMIGLEGHGGMPHQSVDPILMAAEFVQSVYAMMSREISPLHPAVITIGTIEGGTALNSVAHKVTMKGTFRTYSHEVNEQIWEGIYRRAEHISKVYRGTYEVRERFHDGWAVVNTHKQVETVIAAAKDALGENSITILQEANMSGETFGLYQSHMPGAFTWLGAGNKAKGIDKKIHHPQFDIDESALICGVKLHVAIVDQVLNQKE